MFAHSTTLISSLKRVALDSWDNISQGSMVHSWQQLTYLCYLETSLTVLRNYRITAFVNFQENSLWFLYIRDNNGWMYNKRHADKYSEPCYIQNTGIFKIWGIFRTLSHIYDETLIICMAIIVFTNYNY